MPEAFLDTGVVFGYSVPVDQHHRPCADFLESGRCDEIYISDRVLEEYDRMKQDRIESLSTDILDHVRRLMRSDLPRSLDPTDVREIKRNLLDSSRDSYQFLYWYYDEEVSSMPQKRQLAQDLRELARDLESTAIERHQRLVSRSNTWGREESHPSVRSSLSMIHSDDLEICLDAHDLGYHTDSETLFATVNPRDFVDDGRREAVVETTALDGIEDLSM